MKRLVLALAVLGGLTLPATASAAAPAGFVGMVSEDTLAGAPAYRAKQFASMHAAGVTLVRQVFDWKLIERRKDHFDFGYLDGFVGDAARHGIQVMPILFGEPTFRSGRPRAHRAVRGTYPPKKIKDLAMLAEAAVRHYGPNGSFWADHPSIPKLPITAWQVWNEPNLKAYWLPKPSARGYTKMLGAVWRKLNRLDPTAEVVTAGMPDSRIGVPLTTYVRVMLKAGAARWFDTLAINPYAPTGEGVLALLRAMRKQLDAGGATEAGLRATELRWSDEGPHSAFKAGRGGQASHLTDAIDLMAAERDALKLRGFVYFNWKDAPPYPGGKDFWGLHTGLIREAGDAKPALTAFAQAVRALG